MSTLTKPDLLQDLLPEGFETRPPHMDEVEACVKLFNIWSQAMLSRDDVTDANDILTEWKTPGFDFQTDIRLVVAPNGTIVGYLEVWALANPPVHPWMWGRVHPQYNGLGIGTYLLEWGENRTRQAMEKVPDELRVSARIAVLNKASASKQLFENQGFQHIRSNYRMRIDMETAPPEAVWPAGITVRDYTPADAEAVYRADQDAFRDHFGYVEEPFDEGFSRFMHFMTEYEGFDPSLWFLAMDGDEVAGVALGRPHSYDEPSLGWINSLGVRRPWRKRGVGQALLQHAFGEFYRRDTRSVGLGVDAQNLTGALRLYEKVGMHVALQFDQYEKELRPGKEISVQSLES